jgi:hypothetical protein
VIHNGAGADATPIRQVTWSAAGGGGGGGGGPISCSGYLNTNVYTAAWPSTINGSVPMGPLDAGVVKFTTGSGTGNGQISMTNAPNASVTTTHDYVLSATPCDFTGLKKFVGAGAPTIRFNISGSLGVNLLPNTTYYINIRNNDTTGCAVNGGSCDIWPVNLTGPK